MCAIDFRLAAVFAVGLAYTVSGVHSSDPTSISGPASWAVEEGSTIAGFGVVEVQPS